MLHDQELLLYPLDTGLDPSCPCCGQPMRLAGGEMRDLKPDFLTFRCERCGRSEQLLSED